MKKKYKISPWPDGVDIPVKSSDEMCRIWVLEICAITDLGTPIDTWRPLEAFTSEEGLRAGIEAVLVDYGQRIKITRSMIRVREYVPEKK